MSTFTEDLEEAIDICNYLADHGSEHKEYDARLEQIRARFAAEDAKQAEIEADIIPEFHALRKLAKQKGFIVNAVSMLPSHAKMMTLPRVAASLLPNRVHFAIENVFQTLQDMPDVPDVQG